MSIGVGQPRLDDRVASKTAMRLIHRLEESTSKMSQGHLFMKISGRFWGAFSLKRKGGVSIAKKAVSAIKTKTVYAELYERVASCGFAAVLLTKHDPYCAMDSSSGRKPDGLTLEYGIKDTFWEPSTTPSAGGYVLAYFSRHAIERCFKRLGSISTVDLQREIRSGMVSLQIAKLLPLVMPGLEQIWAETENGMFVGIPERSADGRLLWATYTTYISKEGMSERWAAAMLAVAKIMSSDTLQSLQVQGKILPIVDLVRILDANVGSSGWDIEQGDVCLEELRSPYRDADIKEAFRLIDELWWAKKKYIRTAPDDDQAWAEHALKSEIDQLDSSDLRALG